MHLSNDEKQSKYTAPALVITVHEKDLSVFVIKHLVVVSSSSFVQG